MRLVTGIVLSFISISVQGQHNVLYHNDYWPSWSPDGKRIVFTSSRAEMPFDARKDELYIVDIKSGKENQLTDNDVSDNTPHWSSDGKLISFISNRGGEPDVFVMNFDGTGVRQVTKGGQAFNGSTNAISIKRSKVYYLSNNTGKNNIHEVNLDGSDNHELFSTDGTYDNHSFRLSKDEEELIFASNRSGSDRLYVYHFKTGELEEIPIDPGYKPYYPSISSDGRWVSFISFKDERGGDIYRSERDGSNVTRLTATADWDYDPAISPDNGLIAFSSRREGKRGIYVMDADGSHQRKITSKIQGRELTGVIRSRGVDFGLKYYKQHRDKWNNEIYFSGLAMYNLANEFLQQGKNGIAIELFRLALDDPYGGWQVLNLNKMVQLNPSEETWQLVSTMRERVVNKVGYDLLAEKNFESAIKLFEINAITHPESANCWDSLGDGYLNNGQTDKARESFEKALSSSPAESLKVSILAKLEKLKQSNY